MSCDVQSMVMIRKFAHQTETAPWPRARCLVEYTRSAAGGETITRIVERAAFHQFETSEI